MEKTEQLTIAGMSCGHCVMSVKRELTKLANVRIEDVQIGKALVHYDDTLVTWQEISGAIERAGYELIAP